MGTVTALLPNTPKPTALTTLALVLLLLVLVIRLVSRFRTEAACRKDYKCVMLVITVVLAVLTAGATYINPSVSQPQGQTIAMLGGLTLSILVVMVLFRLVPSGGSLWLARIPLALVLLIVVALYLASFFYALGVMANSGGSLSGSWWWAMYRSALVTADVIALVAIPYSLVAIVIAFIRRVIRKLKKKPTTGTP